MTKLQKIEFDILKEFIRICEELQLTYFLVCGSALGAAKYQGFIPWDDDIDVALPRPDYDIFCEKAQAMLPKHLFLQNYKTDPNYPMIFSKLRNSNTTFVEKSLSKLNINHGIYIDVFPVDGYPQDAKSIKKLEREKKRYNLSRLCCLNFKGSWKAKLFVFAEKLILLHKRPSRFVQRLEKQISQYPTSNSLLWCNHGNWQGKLEYAPKEQYGNGIIMKFEGLNVKIPEQYDEYLTQKYGDWKADLPENEKEGHHYHLICDTERSYTTYIKKQTKHTVDF